MVSQSIAVMNKPVTSLMPDDLVGADVVATKLGVQSQTVLALFRRGDLPGYRAGKKNIRFRLAEVFEAMRVKK